MECFKLHMKLENGAEKGLNKKFSGFEELFRGIAREFPGWWSTAIEHVIFSSVTEDASKAA